jgi:predicted ATPase
VFFDRGLIDSAAALEHLTGEPTLVTLGSTYCYYDRVFVTPPWRGIYINDSQRCHGFAADDLTDKAERIAAVAAQRGIVIRP